MGVKLMSTVITPELAKVLKDKLKQKEWDKKGFPPELIRRKWHFKQIINIAVDNIEKKGKIYQRLLGLKKVDKSK